MIAPQQPHAFTSLILGGARSGKSRYAENLAVKTNKNLIYIATAQMLDKEMQERVAEHQKDRQNKAWKTIEEPLALASSLEQHSTVDSVILVDCLTMWLNNLLAAEDENLLQNEVSKLLKCIKSLQGEVIFVSNEVGMGIIPMGELTRQFVDESGRLHQQLAQIVDQVVLMVAGLPLFVKSQNESEK